MSKLWHLSAGLAAALFTAAGAMLTYEVVARYFFTRPTIWAAELSQLCLIWGSMLAMAWLLEHRRHIQVDAVARLLPTGPRIVLDGMAMFVVAVFSAIVAWYGFEIFLDSFQRGRTTGSLLNYPIWIVEVAIPTGFAMLFIQASREVVLALRGHRNALDEPGEDGGHHE